MENFNQSGKTRLKNKANIIHKKVIQIYQIYL